MTSPRPPQVPRAPSHGPYRRLHADTCSPAKNLHVLPRVAKPTTHATHTTRRAWPPVVLGLLPDVMHAAQECTRPVAWKAAPNKSASTQPTIPGAFKGRGPEVSLTKRVHWRLHGSDTNETTR